MVFMWLSLKLLKVDARKKNDVVTRRVSVVKKWSRNYEYLIIHVLGSKYFSKKGHRQFICNGMIKLKFIRDKV